MLFGIAAGTTSAGCASSSDDDPDGPSNFADVRQRVAEIVERTAEALLPGVRGRPVALGPTPCRDAVGASSGTYKPVGAATFELPRGTDGDAFVRQAREALERQGYRVRGTGRGSSKPIAYGDGDDGYGVTVELVSKRDPTLIVSSGPCSRPASDEERRQPPAYRTAAPG